MLGAKRAELFLQPADVFLRRSLADLGKLPRTITVMSEKGAPPWQWDAIDVAGESGSFMCYLNDPTEPKMEMNFRHYADLIRTYLEQSGSK